MAITMTRGPTTFRIYAAVPTAIFLDDTGSRMSKVGMTVPGGRRPKVVTRRLVGGVIGLGLWRRGRPCRPGARRLSAAARAWSFVLLTDVRRWSKGMVDRQRRNQRLLCPKLSGGAKRRP
jgi:hypothetical protein